MIHLLQVTGGRILYEYLIQINDIKQSARIDQENYDPGQLVEMKVPLRTPYYSSTMKYERYYGEIDLDGNYYSYVKRKVQNDTVYILCLVNHDKSAFHKIIMEKVSSLSGDEKAGPVNKAVETPVKKHAASTDYFQQDNQTALNLVPKGISQPHRIFTSPLYDLFPEKPTRPPETGNASNSPDRKGYQVLSADFGTRVGHDFFG